MPTPDRLWLVGAGNMGGALLARWRKAGLDAAVIDPRFGGTVPAEGAPDIVVLAVKPQVWRDAIAPLAGRIVAGTLVVSVMAGVTLAALGERFPAATVARAMPNTPAAVGWGVTGLLAPDADHETCDRLSTLFAHAGVTVWLDHEADFDVVTGLSGSGPAYVFALVEALAAAGEAAGLTSALASTLATETLIGAAALLAESGDPAALRTAVTSPNGTTAAALAVLLPALTSLLRDTVAAAAARSRELAATV